MNPIKLSNQKRLVYSPHVYGPSVFVQTYFNHSNFPTNMFSIWNDHFGFVSKLTGNACVIGEWGGKCTELDRIWMETFCKV